VNFNKPVPLICLRREEKYRESKRGRKQAVIEIIKPFTPRIK
jgi:hypothetical protein